MARQVLTNTEMQALINAGLPVLYKGKVLKTIAELPDDTQILIDYPEYAYTRIEGNAKGLLGYEISGTPSNGVVPQFNGTTKKWELNAVGGGGSSSASDLTSGTLDDARLSTNVTLAGNTFSGSGNLIKNTLPTFSRGLYVKNGGSDGYVEVTGGNSTLPGLS